MNGELAVGEATCEVSNLNGSSSWENSINAQEGVIEAKIATASAGLPDGLNKVTSWSFTCR